MLLTGIRRYVEPGPTPGGLAIAELHLAAVRFGDLPGEYEADAIAAGFGGEERHEEVLGVRHACAFILDIDDRAKTIDGPCDCYRAIRRACLESILDQVEQQLLELRGIRFDDRVRSFAQHSTCIFEPCRTAYQRGKVDGLEAGLR